VSAHAAQATIAVCKNLEFVKKVVLIDEKNEDADDDLVIGLRKFIDIHANYNFKVEEHTQQVIDTNNQVALILCSSGTTGLPKGVEITQANMITCIHAYREFFELLNFSYGNCVSFNIAPW